jgi:hypothetical protein
MSHTGAAGGRRAADRIRKEHVMASYPAVFDIQQQESYDRVQVVIRIVVVIISSILAGILGWFFGLLYLAIPVLAAVMIAQKGAQQYLAESDDNMKSWLRWITALSAWFVMLTDRLPNQDPKETMRFDVTPDGEPSAGNVLLRIILAIPHAIVLGLLGIVAGILIIIAGIMVLIQEKYPEGIFTFLRGYLRWNVRMYVYLAGLAQAYPPFALDTGPEGGEPVGAGVTAQTPPPTTDTGATP